MLYRVAAQQRQLHHYNSLLKGTKHEAGADLSNYTGVARPKIKSKKCTSNVLLMYGKKRGVKKFFPPILTRARAKSTPSHPVFSRFFRGTKIF